MKKLIAFIAFTSIAITSINAQQLIDNLTIGLESNAIWYNDDTKTGKFFDDTNLDSDEHVRANSYLKLDYTFLKNFTATVQIESYEPLALLNYSPNYNDTNFGTYSLNYRNEKLDVTASHFYGQFGSGLIFRSWEDRQLGINNALLGGKATYNPFKFLSVTGMYGKQRYGFKETDSDIFGANAEFDLSDILKFEKSSLNIGLSYVGRKEDITIDDPEFDELTNAFSGRIDYTGTKFYIGAEYVTKSEDAVIFFNQVSNAMTKKGNALQVNTGYSTKGFGANFTFRRMENMSFYSDRSQSGNVFNENVVNFIPGLTKQHDYLLTNIYVYQAQPSVTFLGSNHLTAGEIGGQFDLYYNLKKGSTLGGKYGTKLALNASYWANVKGDYDFANFDYDLDFFGFGQKYFSDISLEVRKKWSKNWSSIFYYVNQYYNKKYVEDRSGTIKTNIGVVETTYKMGKGRSLRFEVQKLWSDKDTDDWVGGTIEFNLNPRFSFYVNNIYNDGEERNDGSEENAKINFYNVGASYSKGATRVGLNYGRQRGGLLCVGGVCRNVAQSTGLTLNLAMSF